MADTEKLISLENLTLYDELLDTKLDTLLSQKIGKAVEYYDSYLKFPLVGDDKYVYIDTSENAIYRYGGLDKGYYCVGRDYNNVEFIQGGDK